MGICSALTEHGYATWSVEYRRAGNGGGWPETFDDIKNGAAHLQTIAKEHNLDLQRVCVAGQSAGGQLALWLSRQKTGNPPLRGVIGLAPATDLRRIGEREPDHALVIVMGGQPSTQSERYAAAAPLEILPLGLPQLIVHGTADSIVPYATSEKYVAVARAAGDSVEFVTIDGAEHLDLWNRASPAFPKVVAAADRFLNNLIGSQVSANEPQHVAAER
jgi:acetyl esterase/lipase